MQNTKGKVVSALAWKFGERISAQLVTFIVSIALARILEPSHYGAIALVNVFIALANVFIISGFGASLIQKKGADNLDFSTVFYVNIALSIVLYLILFISAPLIAEFYNMDILCPVLRVLGFRLILGGVNSVQQAYVSKKMMFKKFFLATLVGTILSGVVGIVLAYKGAGIWALVAQYMTNAAVDTLILWFTVKWRPILAFSFKRLSALFSYGWKLLVSAILDTGYNELRTIIIAKMYSSSDLAYYNKGKSFPDLIITNIVSSIKSVLFPVMSSEQDDISVIKLITRRSIRVTSYIMMPIMIGLALISESLIKLLLTEKWLFCVPYLQISCLTFVWFPIQTANLQAIRAIGRSDIFLKLEIIRKVVALIALCISMQYGVLAIAISGVFTAFASSLINSYPNKRLIQYSYFEQFKDLFNGIIPLLFMILSVCLVHIFEFSPYVLMSLQIITGAIVYVLTSALLKNETYVYILSYAKTLFTR